MPKREDLLHQFLNARMMPRHSRVHAILEFPSATDGTEFFSQVPSLEEDSTLESGKDVRNLYNALWRQQSSQLEHDGLHLRTALVRGG